MLNLFDMVIRGRKVGAIGVTYNISLLNIPLRADTPEEARERLFAADKVAGEYVYSNEYELDRIIYCRKSGDSPLT